MKWLYLTRDRCELGPISFCVISTLYLPNDALSNQMNGLISNSTIDSHMNKLTVLGWGERNWIIPECSIRLGNVYEYIWLCNGTKKQCALAIRSNYWESSEGSQENQFIAGRQVILNLAHLLSTRLEAINSRVEPGL